MEKDILEPDVVLCFDKVAQSYGLISIKITPLGVRGFPDKMYLGFKKVIFFVEFKKPKAKPRKLQLAWHALLKKMGFKIYVFDTTDSKAAAKICRENIPAARIPRNRH